MIMKSSSDESYLVFFAKLMMSYNKLLHIGRKIYYETFYYIFD